MASEAAGAFDAAQPASFRAKAKQVLVVGSAGGGIRSMIDIYDAVRLYPPGRMRYVVSHVPGSALRRLMASMRACLVVAGLLIARRVDLLHLHMSMRGSFWRKAILSTMGRWAGVPVVIHLHGSEFAVFYEGSPRWVQRLIRGIFDRADAVVVLSESWRQFVRQLTTTEIRVIGNFVPDRFDPPRAAANRQRRALLFLGQFGARKGIYDLLPAFVEVRRRFPDAVLYCGGNGEVDKVRAVVRKLGLEEAVCVPGWVRGDEKIDLLHRCAVFVLPSYHEGQPVSIIEAMSCGMPVVSTAVGGIPELVDESVGALVPPGEPSTLARALMALLELPDARFAAVAAASRRRYEEACTPSVGTRRIWRLYRSLGVRP